MLNISTVNFVFETRWSSQIFIVFTLEIFKRKNYNNLLHPIHIGLEWRFRQVPYLFSAYSKLSETKYVGLQVGISTLQYKIFIFNL